VTGVGASWDASAFCIPVGLFFVALHFSFHYAAGGPGTFSPLVCLCVCVRVRTAIPVFGTPFFISLFMVALVDDKCISKITAREKGETKTAGCTMTCVACTSIIWARGLGRCYPEVDRYIQVLWSARIGPEMTGKWEKGKLQEYELW
jgi:hypothetical protein